MRKLMAVAIAASLAAFSATRSALASPQQPGTRGAPPASNSLQLAEGAALPPSGGEASASTKGNRALVFENATDKNMDVLVHVDPHGEANCHVLVNDTEVAVLHLSGAALGTVKPGAAYSINAVGKRGGCKWTLLSVEREAR